LWYWPRLLPVVIRSGSKNAKEPRGGTLIEFKDLQSDDPIIQGELDMLKELNPIFLRIEDLPGDYEMPEEYNHGH
jgi:hypothetical protein